MPPALAAPSRKAPSRTAAIELNHIASREPDRFGLINRLPVTIEWLSDNGSCYVAEGYPQLP
jgi:hypothetical protein